MINSCVWPSCCICWTARCDSEPAHEDTRTWTIQASKINAEIRSDHSQMNAEGMHTSEGKRTHGQS